MFYEELAIDGKVDDILAWLEKDLQVIDSFEGEKIRVVYRSKRDKNSIVVTGTLFEVNAASMPTQISGFGDCEGFIFEVSRITDERSKITGLISHDLRLFNEKNYCLYLARLGEAFNAEWKQEIRALYQSITEELEKEQGWHWGTVEKTDSATGRTWTYHSAKIPNEPVPDKRTSVTHLSSREEKDNLRKPSKSGRPHLSDDEWAWKQVNEAGRNQADVYEGWLSREGVKARNLVDPKRQFKRVTKPDWGNKSGQNI
jgi:hypothetical protein